MLFKYNGERNYLDKRVCIAGHCLVNTYITPSDIYSYIRRAKQSEGDDFNEFTQPHGLVGSLRLPMTSV